MSLSITFLTYATANIGSMPLDADAMMLIVPVGAMVVTVAFLIPSYLSAILLPSKFGKFPRSWASAADALRPSSSMNFINFLPRSSASSAWYGMPMRRSMSANPMTPRPILRLAFVISSICFRGYLLTSITSSRNLTDQWTVSRSLS